MSVKDNTNSILRGLEKYKNFLDGLTDEEFQRTPAEGVWSYSEVYSHILTANTGSLIAIERCIHGNKSSSGRLELVARLILFFGRLPPGKFKVPANVGVLVKKITLEEARNDIIKFRERLLGQITAIAKAPENQKIKHPRLGMLNAKQWLRFIEIHTYHHLRQLERIRQYLAKHS